MAPYAEAAGLHVKTSAALTEPGHADKPLRTAEVMINLLGKPGNRVVCVHRPTLPTIVEMVRAATRPYTRGALPRKNPYLPAGGVLVAHVVDTEVGAARRGGGNAPAARAPVARSRAAMQVKRRRAGSA